MVHRQIGKLSHRLLAGFLIFWLSGVVFLFCHDMPQVEASTAEVCPMAREHSARMESAAGSLPFLDSSRGEDFDCCGFLPAVFDKTRKIEPTPQTVLVSTKLQTVLPIFRFSDTDRKISISYRPPLLPQRNIHVKNCVFRI